MRILHIDTELSWRGGENQLKLLIENAQTPDWEWHLGAPPGSQVITRLKALAHTASVPMKGLGQITAARRLAVYCRENKIQLIDCQSSRAHQIGLMVKYFMPELKLVVHRRVDYPPGSSWFNQFKYKNPRVDRFIAISGAIAKVLKTYGLPAAQVSVVRSAVDPAAFRNIDRQASHDGLSQELAIKRGLPIIANVAYLTEQKGHETLIRALGILKQREIPFFGFIAGEGDLQPALEKLALELGLGQDCLQFLGVRKDVPRLLAASDIFALSSNDEGLGTSLLDAAHSGCCLVGTEVGGIPEIIHHERTGLLAKARDPNDFAQQLERVLIDRQLRQTLAAAVEQFVQGEFSLRQMVEGNLAIYRQLLAPQK